MFSSSSSSEGEVQAQINHWQPWGPWTIFVLFLMFFAAAWGLNRQGFDAPMTYDSKGCLLANAGMFARNDPMEAISIGPHRPVTMLSFQLSYMINEMHPYGFRVFNAAVLAATGAALVVLVYLLLSIESLSGTREPAAHKWISLFAGLCYVVHPVQGLVVLYIWQRSAIMACFFFFAGLAVYLAGRMGRLGSLKANAVTCALMLAGLLSKELLLTFPIMLIIAEAVLFRARGRELLRAAVVIAIISVPAAVSYGLAVNLFHGPESVVQKGILNRLISYYESGGMGLMQIIFTQARMLFAYLAIVCLPWLENLGLVQAVVLSVSLWEPPSTLPAFLGAISWVGGAVALARKRPLTSFGLFFFIVTMGPESLLIPYNQFCGFRPGLPMAGILFIVADLASLVLSKLKAQRSAGRLVQVFATVGLLFVVSLGWATWCQAARWGPLRLWRDTFLKLPPFSATVEKKPYCDILVTYGLALAEAGDCRSAEEVLGRASAINPEDAGIHLNLGNVLARLGKLEEAISHFKRAVAINPDHGGPHSSLGNALLTQGKVPEAIVELQTAVRLMPNLVPAYISLGNAMMKENRTREALPCFQKALDIDPGNLIAMLHLRNAMEKAGEGAPGREKR